MLELCEEWAKYGRRMGEEWALGVCGVRCGRRGRRWGREGAQADEAGGSFVEVWERDSVGRVVIGVNFLLCVPLGIVLVPER